eukprot:m.233575 g.233575  ORF g.233575 m.233575 type:complete len:412 (-) comp19216_c0_seq1:30-1265(-)
MAEKSSSGSRVPQQLQLKFSHAAVQQLLDTFRLAQSPDLALHYEKKGFKVDSKSSEAGGLIDVWPDFLHVTLGVSADVGEAALPPNSDERAGCQRQLEALFSNIPALTINFHPNPSPCSFSAKGGKGKRSGYMISALDDDDNKKSWDDWKKAVSAVLRLEGSGICVGLEAFHTTLQKYEDSRFTPPQPTDAHALTLVLDTIALVGPGASRPTPFLVSLRAPGLAAPAVAADLDPAPAAPGLAPATAAAAPAAAAAAAPGPAVAAAASGPAPTAGVSVDELSANMGNLGLGTAQPGAGQPAAAKVTKPFAGEPLQFYLSRRGGGRGGGSGGDHRGGRGWGGDQRRGDGAGGYGGGGAHRGGPRDGGGRGGDHDMSHVGHSGRSKGAGAGGSGGGRAGGYDIGRGRGRGGSHQ